MSIKIYRCTQPELYAVCARGWENCSQQLEKFSSFKNKYSVAFVESRKKEIENVSLMYDHHQRSARRENSRRELKACTEAALLSWRKLRSYILETWPVEEQGACLKSAGYPYYKEAYTFKWEACTSLLDNAQTFIADNSVRLLANHMDQAFPQEFSIVNQAFKTAYNAYFNSVEKASVGTSEKNQVNNVLYKDLMNMFADAKMIFAKHPDILRKFMFDTLLSFVSGPGTAGIKGVVSNGKTPSTEIVGLLVTIQETDDSVNAEEDGTYRFSHMAAGTYTLLAEAPGYKRQVIPNLLVQTGVYTTMNIILEKEVVKE
jgi:hypothetical protein